MTTDQLARVSLWCERWAAGSASAAQAVGEIRKLCEGVTAGDIVAAHQGSSAEQLAIALMSEARRLHALDEENYDASGRRTGVGDVADRLAQWATDVRQLGVDHARLRESWVQQMAAKDARLERVREAMKDWQRCVAVHQLAHKIMAALDGE